MILRIMMMLCLVPLLTFAAEPQPTLILNAPNIAALPKNFRTCQDPLNGNEGISMLGLAEMRFSGSAQFSDLELEDIKKKIGSSGKIVIVDLRSESHGFINGMAVSWFSVRDWMNKGKTPSEIKVDEAKRLADLRLLKEVEVKKILSKTPEDAIKDASIQKVNIVNVADEEKVVTQHGLDYQRIYVVDHTAPTEEQVKEFISLVDRLPEGTWVHFHCLGGAGRTTTFMCMYDMIKNAKRVSFDDIINRQHLLGGKNLSHFGVEESWKYPYAKQRYEFLKQFYNFSKNEKI